MAGFGFFLALFILIPVSLLLSLGWWMGKIKVFGIILGIMWGCIFGAILIGYIMQKLSAKKILTKSDYYGEYIIDRKYFSGKQADWQYNNFRFEIKDNDSICFYVTDKERILKIFNGTIRTSRTYNSAVIVLSMAQPTHHVLTSNPTTYRSAWNFFLVFNSPKFGNMFFRKGHWKQIKE